MRRYNKTRAKIEVFVIGVLSLLLLCPAALGLDPSLDVSQYAHAAWQFREGFTQGTIKSIAQTPDGYLWLGTVFGLFRFDGVRAEHWQPPANGEPLPSNFVVCLRVARDGTLWIGTTKGLASWRNGKLTRYPDFSDLVVSSILEDRQGTVWIGIYSMVPPGKLCAIAGTNVHCYGSNGDLGNGVTGLYEDSHNELWLVGRYGVWQWRPGPPRFYRMPFGMSSVQNLSEATDGTLSIPLLGRLGRIVSGRLQTQYSYPAPARNANATILLRDRDGGIWIGTEGHGVVHLHGGRADVFSQAEGLSGDHVMSLFEDREGDIWVATLNGLDCFRNYAVATYAKHEGLEATPGWASVVVGQDGRMWMGDKDGLRMWDHGEVTNYGRADENKLQSRFVSSVVRYVADHGLRDHLFASVFTDNADRILVSTPYDFGYMEKGRFVPIRGVPGGLVTSVAQDKQGDLWIANQDKGLLRVSKDGTVQQMSWSSIGHRDGAQSLAADRATGGLWLGFNGGGLVYFNDGQIKESYGDAEGLGGGRISALHVDAEDTVWAGTEGGLSRIKNARILTLTSKNGLPCDGIHWITQDDNHSFWLYMNCGLVRIERAELDAWAKDSQRSVKTAVFDSSDGVPNRPVSFWAGNQVTRSLDGKMWFQGFGGACVIDPLHLPSNKLVPPVHIERITANGKTYDPSNGLRLPPRIHDLKVDYTALSFVAPEKIRFRYQLAGQDRNWREVANDREVQYSNLPPGDYVFRVAAANNSGVWNEEGDTLHFWIAPAYYETTWFRALCLAGVLVLIWGLYRLRLQQVARQLTVGLDASVSERMRIARELHDTLLQNLHGLMFQFQGARSMLPDRPDDAAKVLDTAIGATEQTITDSRDAIQHLRSELSDEGDLEQWLRATSQQLAHSVNTKGHQPVFRITVEGERKNLTVAPQDEVCRIAREILRNSFQHARANSIEVEIRYDDREFRIRIRDDGKGIDPMVLQAGGTAGHWGLRGVRERAQQIGAHLDLWSEVGAGTEIELTVPAAVAYKKAKQPRRFRVFHHA